MCKARSLSFPEGTRFGELVKIDKGVLRFRSRVANVNHANGADSVLSYKTVVRLRRELRDCASVAVVARAQEIVQPVA